MSNLCSQAQLGSPKHLAVDRDDNVLIADEQNARIVKYDAKAETITAILGTTYSIPDRWSYACAWR